MFTKQENGEITGKEIVHGKKYARVIERIAGLIRAQATLGHLSINPAWQRLELSQTFRQQYSHLNTQHKHSADGH